MTCISYILVAFFSVVCLFFKFFETFPSLKKQHTHNNHFYTQLLKRSKSHHVPRIRRVRATVFDHQGTNESSLFIILSLFRSRAFILCRVVLLRRRKESHRDRKTNVSSHRFSLFIIEQEQSSKQRLRGIEAQKANILAAKSVARTLRSSLGPKV